MVSMASCARGLALSLTLLLAACGGGGGGASGIPSVPNVPGATGAPSTIPTLTPSGNEGTVQSPVAVAVATPRSSSVSVMADSYYSFTVASTDTYRISLTNPNADVRWTLYSDSGFSISIATCDNVFGAAGNEICYINLNANTTYYLRVGGFAMNFAPITFTLDVRALTNDGTASAPVDLAIGGAPRASSVALAGASYYRFLTGAAGAYTLGVTNSRGLWGLTSVQIEIYATPLTSLSPTLLKRCNPTTNPSCTINGLSANTLHYVKVIGSGSGGVEYDVTASAGVSEGSVAAPVVLTLGALPRTGAVDAYGTSYYSFTTSTMAGAYILSTSTAASLAITVYTDRLFTVAKANCNGGVPCTLTLEPSTQYFVAVANSWGAVSASYQIGVARGLTEGTPTNPIALTVGAPTHSASIGPGTTASYVFTTTAFAGSYTIALTGTQKDLSWQVSLASADFFRQVNFTCDNVTTAGPGDETCSTPNLEPNTTYTLSVTNKELTGPSTYNLALTAGGGSEGAYYTPLVLAGTGALTYGGSVRPAGHSYYSFTTGPKALTYIISASALQSNLGWSLTQASTGIFATTILDCNNYADTTTETCATSDRFSTTAVLAPNTTYRLLVSDYGLAGGKFNLSLTPLDPAAGCDVLATQCFNFEDGIFPSAFTQTSGSTGQQWKWGIDAVSPAATGTKSIRTGKVSYLLNACFNYTPTVKPASVSFSVNRDSGNSLTFNATDGVTSTGYAPGDAGLLTGWRRIRVDTSKIVGPVKLEWCVQANTITPVGSDTIWLDDIELK